MDAIESSKVAEAATFVQQNAAGPAPRVGLVLGSGLGALADELSQLRRLPYASIPHHPTSSVAGHAGNLCLGELGGVRVACMQGRVHAYEGHALGRVVFGVRLLAELGCGVVLLSNAAGGIAERLYAGSLMRIDDHINLMGDSPLRGPSARGPRFPDMSRAYDAEVAEACALAARDVGVELLSGVYAGLLGPSYETPAEIRMLATLGADAVGMSTVPEVIALRQMGVRVGAVSCITNLAAGRSPEPLSHTEVEATAARVKADFVRLFTAWVQRVGGVA
ncbi:MAG: Purine nucleoside phosphorylase [Polyangiaceae bacterium]|jgi:purine-nucleoside phosphorylase|nr:Purine nucleoside phosphorylase [Polyangiaceae bacterium]